MPGFWRIGEPLQGELPGKEGSGSTKKCGDDGRMLEGVGPVLQPAHAVRARSDVWDHGNEEDPILGIWEAVWVLCSHTSPLKNPQGHFKIK